MPIKTYTLDQAEKWDEIVTSFKEYDVYYLNAYVRSFFLHGDGEPLLIYFENASTRAIHVVMKRDIATCERFQKKIEPNQYYDFSTPYGYSGFLIEGDDVTSLKKEYTLFCKEQSIVSEFVRFHPILKNHTKSEQIYDVEYIGKTVAVDVSSPERMWGQFTSKNRGKIRKAIKSGLKVYQSSDEALIPEFMRIYNQTMKRDHATSYYYFDKKFYESIITGLEGNATFFYTKHEDKIIAIAIILFANGQAHYHLSASEYEYMNLAPTNLLLYEVALYAHSIGCNVLHLGGGRGAQIDSLYTFKKAFNKDEDCDFYIGKKIYNEEMYNTLIELSGIEDHEVSFFPIYRK